MTKKGDKIWDDISDNVATNVKVYLLRCYVPDIIHGFGRKIDMIVRKYTKYLPQFVAESEMDDLKTIAQLELIETLKVWNPNKNQDVWPLARARIVGAMKDHIRYITKSDPSRFYDWITDAAYMYMTVNQRADFEEKIENGVELSQAMNCLTNRERTIVIAHSKEDITFKKIGERIGISESQVSRVYKKAIEKIKKQLADKQ